MIVDARSFRASILAAVGLGVLAWTSAAYANVGVPLLSFYFTYTVLLLIPIVVVEAVVYRRELAVSFGRGLGAASLANLTSTLAGGVIVFATFFFDLGSVPGTASDLMTLLLLYPFYRLSVAIERPVAHALMRAAERSRLINAVVLANRATYFMLAVFIVTRIIKGRIVHGYFY